jgi:hypothetical protein
VSAAKRKTTSAPVLIHGREVSDAGYNKAMTTSIKGILERVRRFGRFIK